MEPLQQLDEFLKTLLKNKENSYKDSIFSLTKIKGETITWDDAILILNKLRKDGYVIKIEKTHKDLINEITSEDYQLTFEGKVFIQLGGYTKENIDNKRKSNQRAVYIIAVGIGTALAGLYGLLEIIKSLLNYFYDCK